MPDTTTMDLRSFFSASEARIDRWRTLNRIARALERLHLPLELPDSNRADDLLEAMRADKKARAGQIRMALPTQVGRMHGSDGTGWTVAVDESSLRQVLVNR